jgi:hypothetical protein
MRRCWLRRHGGNRRSRAGQAVRVTFHELNVQSPEPQVDLLVLDTALTALA